MTWWGKSQGHKYSNHILLPRLELAPGPPVHWTQIEAEVKGAIDAAVEVSPLKQQAGWRVERVELKEHMEDIHRILQNEREHIFTTQYIHAIVKSYNSSFIRPKNYRLDG